MTRINYLQAEATQIMGKECGLHRPSLNVSKQDASTQSSVCSKIDCLFTPTCCFPL